MNTKKNELMSQYAIKEQKIGPYAFQQWGHGQETVVYLHGWQDNGNSFLPLQRLLTQPNAISLWTFWGTVNLTGKAPTAIIILLTTFMT